MEILIVVVFLVIFGVITLYVSMQKKSDANEKEEMPVIHTSGIYSVIRKSPRENIYSKKPEKIELEEFVNSSDKDMYNNVLSESEKVVVIEDWDKRINDSITLIEEKDQLGVQRFLIKPSNDCDVCKKVFGNSSFVTREDIFNHPELIPPYYPGCSCTLNPESDWESPLSMKRFKIDSNEDNLLPTWKQIRKVK